MNFTLLPTESLDELSRVARQSPRLRKNFNMHPHLESTVQRLFNAMEPGTYVRPHRHARPNGWEMMLIVRGRFDILLFDEAGKLTHRHKLGEKSHLTAAEIPAFTWHSVISLESGTVMFEVKEGPYQPVSPSDFAPWAPGEEEVQATATFMRWAEKAQVGDQL